MSMVELRGRSGAEAQPAELTLVLLHHAGGSAGSFVPLLPYLPESWRIVAPELPARATSRAQAPAPSLESAADTCAEALDGDLSGPFALFGHCLGAILAFELAHRLAEQGRRPLWFGVSGSPTPRLASRPLAGGPPAEWSRDQLIDYMRQLGGTPEALWRNTVLADRMLASLRNDLVLAHDYECSTRSRLSSPLAVMRGESDPLVGAEEMLGWPDHSDGATEFVSWPGDHFYLFYRAPEVGAWLVDAITTAAERADSMVSS